MGVQAGQGTRLLEIERRWRGAPGLAFRILTSSPVCSLRAPPAPPHVPWGAPAGPGAFLHCRGGSGAPGEQDWGLQMQASVPRIPATGVPPSPRLRERWGQYCYSMLGGWASATGLQSSRLEPSSSPFQTQSLEPGECHLPISTSITADRARYLQQACLLLDRPRRPLHPQEPLGELMGKDRAEGEARLALEDRDVAQRGQGLQDPAALVTGHTPHLGTEATGSTSRHPPEVTQN